MGEAVFEQAGPGLPQLRPGPLIGPRPVTAAPATPTYTPELSWSAHGRSIDLTEVRSPWVLGE